MKNEIYYILPDFMAFGRNEILIKLLKSNPYIFKDNVNIYSIYGTFPKAIWNGGRNSVIGNYLNQKEMKKIRNYYNKNGIAIVFTFSNLLLEEKHLKDPYCNAIMKVFENEKNEVLISSPILENYIRKNYPKYKINKSITSLENNTEQDFKKYHLTVINKIFNKDFKKLNELKYKEKIELLCDEVCFNDCPYTKEHYMEISAVQLNNNIKGNNPYYGKCRFENKIEECERINYRNKNSKYYISPEQVENKYVPMGYKFFKLSGRETFNVTGYSSIINYLIKPKYQEDLKVYIYERMLLESISYYERVINENEYGIYSSDYGR